MRQIARALKGIKKGP